MVHAMGNTEGGGVQDGLASPAYQVGISGLVTKLSTMPTPRHIATLSAKRTTYFSRIIAVYRSNGCQM